MIRAVSLGAGVQSSTMALMFAAGELTPMPDLAVFADTQSEPAYIYEWLEFLDKQLPFPIERVTVGSLRSDLMQSLNGSGKRVASIPFYTSTDTVGQEGKMRRQCTEEYKIEPITRLYREKLGLTPRRRLPKTALVTQYIGMSFDEVLRMKPSRQAWIEHRWPLIEKRMTRGHCLEWMQENGFPLPKKSACTFCPFHSDRAWHEMKANDPKSWDDAVAVDTAIRSGTHNVKQKLFLHRSMKPLADVDLSQPEDFGQVDAFTNECTGMCGA